MSKISIGEVESVLAAKKLDKVQIKAIISELEEIIKETQEEKTQNKQPKSKNQFVLVCVTEEESVKQVVSNATIYITQIKEGSEHNEIPERIKRAAAEYNETKKGGKNPVKTFSDTISFVKRKFFKAQNVAIKSGGEPSIIIVTPNKL